MKSLSYRRVSINYNVFTSSDTQQLLNTEDKTQIALLNFLIFIFSDFSSLNKLYIHFIKKSNCHSCGRCYFTDRMIKCYHTIKVLKNNNKKKTFVFVVIITKKFLQS